MRALGILLIFIVSLLVIPSQGDVSLDVNVNTKGGFIVSVNGESWLESGDYALRFENNWYSTKNGTLTLKERLTTSGKDVFGSYLQVRFSWSANGKVVWQTAVKSYPGQPLIIFTQQFPLALANTQTGNNVDVISAFPSFLSTVTNRKYLTFSNTFASPHLGNWDHPTGFPGGAIGGSPVAFFDSALNTLVMSPLTNFMVGVQTRSAALDGQLACGLQGKITNIPANFTHSTIVTAGTGVNFAFERWGKYLLQNSGKKQKTFDDDYTVKHLGYWTDHGGYYYYLTEPGKNYAQTMADVYTYIQKTGLPFKYFQFDSWWYYQGATQGLVLWEPRPEIFPNGMKDVQKQIGGLPLVLHNRWFEQDNDYATKLKFPFITEKSYGLPTSEETYLYLMGKAKEGGLLVYEQDWLDHQYLQMEATQNNVTNAHNWMMYMNNAALKLDLTIQLCMPLPLHVLQSSLMDSVTHIRASGDYQRLENNQWQLGTSSMLIKSLGVFPYKDTFWSNTATQTGCTMPDICNDPNAPLEALISTLTAGPVGPSDKIGFLDEKVVMSTCRSDGVLLKPDVPATTMDLVYKVAFEASQPVIYQLTSTYSTHKANVAGKQVSLTFHYVLAVDTTRAFIITPADLSVDAAYTYLAYQQNKTGLKTFGHSNSLVIPALPSNVSATYQYWVLAPQIAAAGKFVYTLLGEQDKYVACSTLRFSNWNFYPGSHWKVDLKGGSHEVVHLRVANALLKVSTFSCTLSSAGFGTFTCTDSKCSCGLE